MTHEFKHLPSTYDRQFIDKWLHNIQLAKSTPTGIGPERAAIERLIGLLEQADIIITSLLLSHKPRNYHES